ncbi:coagulation factor 5/8 type domain-containing protein [Bythopirellula polymerisocia]|nr:coagulation factor 5/8 type domain-containing protein [Bythopirellula polymerisocia]
MSKSIEVMSGDKLLRVAKQIEYRSLFYLLIGFFLIIAFTGADAEESSLKAGAGSSGMQPDFGPNVFVFEPGQLDAQHQIDTIFKQQERAQFGTGRYALLFKPGSYELEVPVGFYTHVAGLGELPDDVQIAGHVWTDAAWMNRNATCNFWRAVENLSVVPPDGVNVWAISQAAPMRRTHIQGDLHLSSGGWSSGGYLADCKVDGSVVPGTQQQWLSRNSEWKQWIGGAWNMVFVGCKNAPEGEWPDEPFTVVVETQVVREKPYLIVDSDGRWFVVLPPLRKRAAGITWGDGETPGEKLPLEDFYLAKPDEETAESINAALRAGKHLLLTPGIYSLEDTIVVSRPGTIVLGLGLPSLVSSTGKTTIRVDAAEGVDVSGILFDAGSTEVDTLFQVGLPDQSLGNSKSPICLHDVFCRVGGNGEGKSKCMVTIYSDHVVGENLWLWRADHGKSVGWDDNTCETGLRVEGDEVTIFGLFVEHTQKHQTVWNGNGGRVYFYQSEMPYDPPSQEAWRSGTGDGYASYKVGEDVTTHEAWGLGVYHVFKDAPVVAENAIETPDVPGIIFHHALTYRLSGGQQGSGILNVINGQGGEVVTRQKATVK